jgi:hypothetical protein
MFGRFFYSSNKQGSADAGFESASFCASFFAVLLLLVDTVIAVSIFVSADIATSALFLGVCAALHVVLLRVLFAAYKTRRSKLLAVSI